jgi:anti-sigma B factor antagonist
MNDIYKKKFNRKKFLKIAGTKIISVCSLIALYGFLEKVRAKNIAQEESPKLKMNQREKQGIIILDIQGEIDLYTAPEIKSMIRKLINSGENNVILNFEKVSYIDSSGIGALIWSMDNLKKYQGSLLLINVVNPVKKVFELTKLNFYFEIYDSENEALSKFK